jgi:zinc transport system permease protein
MSEMFARVGEYLAFPFVRYAFAVGVLVALCAGLLGVPLVLKRFSFIGDGLSHVAFGALAVATVLRLAAPMALVLPVTALCAVALLRTGSRSRIQGDAAIAMLSSAALAAGYLLLHVFPVSSNIAGDVCSTLFGSASILTLTAGDVALAAVMAAVVLGVFALCYHRIFAVTFDEEFARGTGIQAGAYNLLLAVIAAVVIVLALELVGSLLISALVVFPALSAMGLCRSFRGVTLLAAALAVACAAVGIFVSILLSTPVGPTIVLADGLVFLVCRLAGMRH